MEEPKGATAASIRDGRTNTVEHSVQELFHKLLNGRSLWRLRVLTLFCRERDQHQGVGRVGVVAPPSGVRLFRTRTSVI
jgi:hypothetical protein